jgi:SAM-dependent methyltransferase
MTAEPVAGGFNINERGDRLRPHRNSHNYQVLSGILRSLRRILDSDLLSTGECILDYGCGSRPYEALFTTIFKKYMGADIAGNIRADIVLDGQGKVPVVDESFDCVLSSQVLEHVVNPQRVLRRGGHLIISTHGVWPYHPDPVDLWRWTIDGLQHEICRVGFDIVRVESVFGLESCALQLWQDATYARLPRFVQPAYLYFFQAVIGLIERRHPGKVSKDAAVYIVLARKSDLVKEISTDQMK